MAKTQSESFDKRDNFVLLRVAGGSNSSKVAGALFKYLEEGNDVSLIGMGAGAVNQMVKAVAIARGIAAPHGYNLSCIPAFRDEIVNGVSKTAIVVSIIPGK
jgi:stage V sporulation protein S